MPSKKTKKTKTFESITLRVPVGGRDELERKRKNAGERSVNAYCVSMLFDGKCNGHKKKP